MNNSLRRLRNLGLYTALGAVAAVPGFADDTEIYTGLNNLTTSVNPNVMFIIDSSGSMNASESVAVAQFDPGTNYPGSCNPARVYWSTSGQVPSCSTSRYFQKSSFRCDAADVPLFATTATATGFYQDRIARYKDASFFSSASWTTLSTNAQDPPHVECQADEGNHGETTGNAAVYIQDDSQAYTTDANDKKNWLTTGSFVTLYSANYVNYFNDPGSISSSTRIDIVKDVVKELVDSNTNLNIALMRFDLYAHGGPIIYPFSDIDATGVRTGFKASVDSLYASGNTPLSETLSEALRVYRGDPAVYGKSPPAHSATVSTPLAFSSGTTYESPLDVQCQKNFIVFLSDGVPTADNEADSFINGLLADATLPSNDVSCGGSDNCLDELAEYMNESDLVPGLDGKQNVVLYTIGFGSDAAASTSLNELLTQAGTKGGGDAFIASDFRQLSNTFTQIITEIQSVNTTFTAPAVSVNAFNRITNREELFFTLFKPKQEPIWTGNMKRYRIGQLLDGNGDPVDANGDGEADAPEVLDAQGKLAVSSQTGFFDAQSTSFWTTALDAPDGEATALGGAARLFGGGVADPAQARNVYSNVDPGTDNLSAAINRVDASNATLIADPSRLGLTGAVGEPAATDLLKWLSGIDVKDEDADGSSTDARRVMGDPLHAKPLLLEYAPAPTTAVPEPPSDITIFMATNEGLLHAIDSDDGTEVFSFTPKQQLERTLTYFNNSSTGFKDYGLDGPVAVYFKDTNGNGFLDAGAPDNDRYIVVVGERRGGTRYYAVDVTNRSAPKFLWNIVGGVGDFYELAQTWSEPIATQIKLNGTVKDVFVFGGGYDTSQDQADTARTADNSGRAIYVVDALTGALVWWAGKSGLTGPNSGDPTPNLNVCVQETSGPNCSAGDMDYSIPGDLRVIDINGNGQMDRIYTADMGGRILRIDIDNEGNSGASSLATGVILADLQKSSATSTPTAADNRRFFYAPDVALFTEGVPEPFLSVALGSGYRAHPLNTTVKDRFYMVQDKAPFAKPTTYENTLTEGDLKDVTDDLDPDLSGVDGWFIRLVDSSGTNVGEKVLATATTFSGTILFTTFAPVGGASSGSCAPNQGTGQVFAVSAIDAKPTPLFEPVSGGTSTTDPRVISTLVRTGIPPEVTILFPPSSDPNEPVALVAAEKLQVKLINIPVKTYWFEQEKL